MAPATRLLLEASNMFMKDLSAIQARYARDPLPVRLGGLAADMARIASFSQNL